MSVTATYTLAGRHWMQEYLTCLLGDNELGSDLHAADLRLDGWLSDDGRWVVARPGH